MSEDSKIGNTIILNFAEAQQPVFMQARRGKFVWYGEDNLYPEYLLDLFKTAAKHGAIVGSKATYVTGKGWKAKTPDPAADAFMARVNRYDESLYDITERITLDLEIFNGSYLQIIWNNAGTGIAEVYHLPFTTIRTNHNNTQFYWRESWNPSVAGYKSEEKLFPVFNPAVPKGSQIYFLKAYEPAVCAYPSPDYLRGLNYISAEIEVGKHTYSNAQSGFSASKSITFMDGSNPTDDEKRKVSKDMKRKFTGEKGDKILINFCVSSEKKPIIEDLGSSDLTKEDFTAVDTLIQTNIFSAHKITTPALFGIPTPGALGQHSELRYGYEIFQNTYVNGKQQFIESAINKIAGFAGVNVELNIIPTEPVGIDLALVKDFAPLSWLYDAVGIDPAKYPGPGITPQPIQPAQGSAQMEAETNPLLRNITGRQWQGINRLVREVTNGKTTDAVARMMLASSYGLTNEQIDVLLGTTSPGDEMKMSADESADDIAISTFAEFGADKEGYVILKSKKVNFADESEAEEKEFSFLKFVKEQLTELQASVLDLVQKDKRITPEVLAETLGEEVKTIKSVLKTLETSGKIVSTENSLGEIERELPKPVSEISKDKPVTTRYRVVYSYEGPQDDRNRPFCARLMTLNRMYTRSEIESISQRLGYSVWDRRGGFYHNPTTDKTTPYCRHTWMSHVVISKK